MESRLRSVERQGAHETGGVPRGVGAHPTLVDRVWALGLDSFTSIFLYFPKLAFVDFQVIPRTSVFYT